MSANQANHDPSLSHSSTNGQNPSSNVGTTNAAAGDVSMQLSNNQIISLLRNIPEFLGKVCSQYLLLAPINWPNHASCYPHVIITPFKFHHA
jgi:hypothetical protein